MSDGTPGTIIQQGITMRINNAFVEEVSCTDNSGGFIVVSYSVQEADGIVSIRNIRLNINRNTTVINDFGQSMCVCCIQPGMWVNVVFSSRMTRSIPPQSNAYLVVVRRNARPPQRPSAVTTGRIIMIDFDNNFIITENPRNVNDQIKFIITNATTFTNRIGIPIRFSSLNPGQMVRITHANFMTASIPPQTTAFNVQLI